MMAYGLLIRRFDSCIPGIPTASVLSTSSVVPFKFSAGRICCVYVTAKTFTKIEPQASSSRDNY